MSSFPSEWFSFSVHTPGYYLYDTTPSKLTPHGSLLINNLVIDSQLNIRSTFKKKKKSMMAVLSQQNTVLYPLWEGILLYVRSKKVKPAEPGDIRVD